MSEANQVVSDDGSSASGVQEDQPKTKEEVVAYETHARLLGQRKKDQDRMKTLEEENNKFKQTQKIAEETKMQEQGEYKKLLESRTKETEELRSNLAQKDRMLTDGVKLQAFVDKLPGRVAKNDYLQFAQLERIAMDPETGRIDDLTLGEVVNDFIKNHQSLMVMEGKTLPADNAAPGSARMSYEDWLKLPTATEKKKHWDEVDKN